MAERKPRDLRTALDAVVSAMDGRGELSRARAVEVWARAVGDEVAKRTHCVALRKGELLVHADSNAWATELQAMSPQIAEAVNREAGKPLVSTVRFSVSKAVRAERERVAAEVATDELYHPERVEPVPLTAEEAAQVERAAASIPDEGLRAAAVKAATTDLEWKKGVREAGRKKA